MVKATVRRRWAVTPRLTGLVLEVEETVGAAYVTPGQYLMVDLGEGAFPLAIASAPGEKHALELLLEVRDPEQVEEGRELEITAPQGAGFRMEMDKGANVAIFAVGSALSAVRPVVEVLRRARRDYGRITFFYTARSEEELGALSPHEAEWTADDIDIRTAVDRPFVQEMFESDPVPIEVAFVCGMKAMMQAVQEMLVRHGVREDNILRNF